LLTLLYVHSRYYFTIQTNPGEQFYVFSCLSVWLIKDKCGLTLTTELNPQDYEDPNVTIHGKILRGDGDDIEINFDDQFTLLDDDDYEVDAVDGYDLLNQRDEINQSSTFTGVTSRPQGIMVSSVDSAEWKLEVERVLPQLKVILRSSDSKADWRAHVNEMNKHRDDLGKHFESTSGGLKKLTDEITKGMNQINSREK
jgi:estrogen-related receptor beta like 1